MAKREPISLRQAPMAYDQFDQDRLRREIEKIIVNLDNDALSAKMRTDKISSLAMRRFQFMGFSDND